MLTLFSESWVEVGWEGSIGFVGSVGFWIGSNLFGSVILMSCVKTGFLMGSAGFFSNMLFKFFTLLSSPEISVVFVYSFCGGASWTDFINGLGFWEGSVGLESSFLGWGSVTAF